MRLTADYPPVWLAGFAALGWLAGWIWPVTLPAQAALGWFLIAAGLLLMALAARQMIAHQTTLDPHGQPAGLVTGGVFRLSRNPIYLADLLLLAGLCLLARAPWAMPFLVALLAAIITRRFIRPEEARLQEAFGADYTAFCTRTRRWL